MTKDSQIIEKYTMKEKIKQIAKIVSFATVIASYVLFFIRASSKERLIPLQEI